MSDLSIATRDMFEKSFVYQVGLRMPYLAMFLEHRRVSTKGGYQLTYHLVKDDAEDEVQSYLAGTGLTSAQSEFLAQAKFNWKYMQAPLRYDVDTEIKNQLGSSAVKRRDLVKLIVERGQNGIRKKLETQIHATGSTDAGADFQSVHDALDHARTYGELLSTTAASVQYWNGASLGDNYTDRATATALSLSNIRLMKAIVKRYVAPTSKLYGFLPEALHSKLQGLLEGSKVYTEASGKNSLIHKHGFESFHAYGIEFVMDSYMTLNSQTAYMTLINPETWDFRLHPSRAFKVTKFVDQSQVSGGADEHLARVKIAGALICKKPRANMWKSNVS